MKFVERSEGTFSAAQLAAAERELEQQKKEWELDRLRALREEEERRLRLADDDEKPLTFGREDAQNQVNNTTNSKRVAIKKRRKDQNGASPIVASRSSLRRVSRSIRDESITESDSSISTDSEESEESQDEDLVEESPDEESSHTESQSQGDEGDDDDDDDDDDYENDEIRDNRNDGNYTKRKNHDNKISDRNNRWNLNSPRTRSRGDVKINLWTLDVSPILPGVKPNFRSRCMASRGRKKSIVKKTDDGFALPTSPVLTPKKHASPRGEQKVESETSSPKRRKSNLNSNGSDKEKTDTDSGKKRKKSSLNTSSSDEKSPKKTVPEISKCEQNIITSSPVVVPKISDVEILIAEKMSEISSCMEIPPSDESAEHERSWAFGSDSKNTQDDLEIGGASKFQAEIAKTPRTRTHLIRSKRLSANFDESSSSVKIEEATTSKKSQSNKSVKSAEDSESLGENLTNHKEIREEKQQQNRDNKKTNSEHENVSESVDEADSVPLNKRTRSVKRSTKIDELETKSEDDEKSEPAEVSKFVEESTKESSDIHESTEESTDAESSAAEEKVDEKTKDSLFLIPVVSKLQIESRVRLRRPDTPFPGVITRRSKSTVSEPSTSSFSRRSSRFSAGPSSELTEEELTMQNIVKAPGKVMLVKIADGATLRSNAIATFETPNLPVINSTAKVVLKKSDDPQPEASPKKLKTRSSLNSEDVKPKRGRPPSLDNGFLIPQSQLIRKNKSNDSNSQTVVRITRKSLSGDTFTQTNSILPQKRRPDTPLPVSENPIRVTRSSVGSNVSNSLASRMKNLRKTGEDTKKENSDIDTNGNAVDHEESSTLDSGNEKPQRTAKVVAILTLDSRGAHAKSSTSTLTSGSTKKGIDDNETNAFSTWKNTVDLDSESENETLQDSNNARTRTMARRNVKRTLTKPLLSGKDGDEIQVVDICDEDEASPTKKNFKLNNSSGS